MTEPNAAARRETTPVFEQTAVRANRDCTGGPVRSRPSRPDPARSTDEQADGCWANLVRAYEDGS